MFSGDPRMTPEDVARLRAVLRRFVRFSAAHPELIGNVGNIALLHMAGALDVPIDAAPGLYTGDAVGTGRRLDDEWDVPLVRGLIEVVLPLAGVFLVPPQVEVAAVVDALDLVPPEGELVLDVEGRLGVVRQFAAHARPGANAERMPPREQHRAGRRTDAPTHEVAQFDALLEQAVKVRRGDASAMRADVAPAEIVG